MRSFTSFFLALFALLAAVTAIDERQLGGLLGGTTDGGSAPTNSGIISLPGTTSPTSGNTSPTNSPTTSPTSGSTSPTSSPSSSSNSKTSSSASSSPSSSSATTTSASSSSSTTSFSSASSTTMTQLATSDGHTVTSTIISAVAAPTSSTTSSAPSSTASSLSNSSGNSPSGLSTQSKSIIGGVVGGVGGLILIGGIAIVAWRLWGKRRHTGDDEYFGIGQSEESIRAEKLSSSRPGFATSALNNYTAPQHGGVGTNF